MLTVSEAEFGKMPIRALESPKACGEFFDYQGEVWVDHPREADNRLTIPSLVSVCAVDRGRISRNLPVRYDLLYSADRADMIWTEADVARLMDGAEIDLQRAMILAIHTGQRYSDLIRLRCSDFDGVTIWLKQSKGQKRVTIKCIPTLNWMLEEIPRECPTILIRDRGKPWHTAKDDKALAKARKERMKAAGFYPTGWDNLTVGEKREHLRFNDLTGTAVTLLTEAGASIPQLCAITGHSLQSATRILERCMSMTEALSTAANDLFQHASVTACTNRLQNAQPVAVNGVAKTKENQ